MKFIEIKGAKTHNLKNIDVKIPRNKLVVITGLSGSGKSSLAFDTLYAEGQRKYVESLSSYARQFLSLMDKPDVEHIEGLSPAISIEQKSTSHNPRSTVGTVTEIYDYLRVLYARAGEAKCPKHNVDLKAQSITQMIDKILALPENKKFMILSPIVRNQKGEHKKLLMELQTKGFIRGRLNKSIHPLDEFPVLNPKQKNNIDIVIDRFKIKPDIKDRLADSLETCLDLSSGIAIIASMDDDSFQDIILSNKYACPLCDYTIPELEPRNFSFNNPIGACNVCGGLGVEQYFDPVRIIPNDQLSISQGAIKGWDKRNRLYYRILKNLSVYFNFSLDTPWKALSEATKNLILHGTQHDSITFEYANALGDISLKKHSFEGVLKNFKRRYKDTDSMYVREELSKLISSKVCSACNGSRLKPVADNIYIQDLTLPKLVKNNIRENYNFFSNLKLSGEQKKIAEKLLIEIIDRLNFLVNVGLDYISLARGSDTLSGGEAQRIRLASQIGSGLVGVMYVLDEPSIGLHQRDNQRLLDSLLHLKNLGNTVIIVEHDEDAIRAADHIIDIGPGAGVHGGKVIAQGDLNTILKSSKSLTAKYLNNSIQIQANKVIKSIDKSKVFKLIGATGNNLKDVTLELPVGVLTCITGVSGSGKSTLINETLYKSLHYFLNKGLVNESAPFRDIQGIEFFDKIIAIDQKPIGRTPRSNPATYTGIFTPIRELFASTQDARSKGYKPGRFSFNVKGGRCEFCKGDGLIKVEMHFLSDVYVTCETCGGKRYNEETLSIKYKHKTISDVLNMTVENALSFFDAIPVVKKKLQTLMDVGLSYITLGQSATTLSGGEAQRIKLAKELSKRDTGKTLYILDEPTTGLHFHDINQLLNVLHTLKKKGNTIVVIEHNLDVIKTADWIIDLGPEGGENGGEIIASGTPNEIIENARSYTGKFLKIHLNK